MGVIYGLFDPRKSLAWENCRYIGQTTTPIRQRLSAHISHARTTDRRTPRDLWVRKLLAQDVEPVVHPLETVANSELAEREIYWIATGRRMGLRLLNASDGGESGSAGYRFTPEQRSALSETVKRIHKEDPTIAERKRAGQMRRFSDPAERERMGQVISGWIATLDHSDQMCPECGKGPFAGVWGLATHSRYDHDPQPMDCPECNAGPFIGAAGLAAHKQHKHSTPKDQLMCECGAGPFNGKHGLGIHLGRFCPYTHSPEELAEWPTHLTDVYANNDALRNKIAVSGKLAKASEDKTPSICPCGAGPFKGPRALRLHQTKKRCQING